MSHRVPPPIPPDTDPERRLQTGAEVIADAMIALHVRERLRELDALDAAAAAAAEERERARVRKAVRRGMRASPAGGTPSPAAHDNGSLRRCATRRR